MASRSALSAQGLMRAQLRAAKNFHDYNFREYFVGRVRDSFRENRGVSDPERITALMQRGHEDLEMLRRQSAINNFYHKRGTFAG